MRSPCRSLGVLSAGALSLGVAAAVLVPATASADTGADTAAAAICAAPVTDSAAAPASLVVGTTDVKWLTYTVWTDTACDVDLVDVAFFHSGEPVNERSRRVAKSTRADAAAAGEEWTFNVAFDPADLDNADAGTLTTTITATATDGTSWSGAGKGYTLKRWPRVTNNATPEPVAKGKTITIAGKLSRANWDSYEYHGYTGQRVALQFRTTTGSYATVRTLTTPSGGSLRTTVTASRDGCFRFAFAGSSTTGPINGAGDCVDVR